MKRRCSGRGGPGSPTPATTMRRSREARRSYSSCPRGRLRCGRCLQLVHRSPHFPDAIGILSERGHLLAIAQDQGLFAPHLRRALSELRYANSVDHKLLYCLRTLLPAV
jgi:hypothetical protein